MHLPFKSPLDFLEYCNAQFSLNPKKGEGRPALVPERGYMGTANHVSRTADGRFRASLIIAGPPEGFFLVAETPNVGRPDIKHGDLIIWTAFKAPPLSGKGIMGKATGDKRSSWLGFIVAKIAPEIDANGKFVITERFP